jgi:hypothetical protein
LLGGLRGGKTSFRIRRGLLGGLRGGKTSFRVRRGLPRRLSRGRDDDIDDGLPRRSAR